MQTNVNLRLLNRNLLYMSIHNSIEFIKQTLKYFQPDPDFFIIIIKIIKTNF